jgi:hypothetical protein
MLNMLINKPMWIDLLSVKNASILLNLFLLQEEIVGLCGCFVKAKAKYKPSECPDKPPRWLAVPLK